MCESIAVLSKTMSFDPTAIIFACRQFSVFAHPSINQNCKKRRNLRSKRRNLPAKRIFLFFWVLPGHELDSRRALFLRKIVFFRNQKNILLFWEMALILHVGRSRYIHIYTIIYHIIYTYIYIWEGLLESQALPAWSLSISLCKAKLKQGLFWRESVGSPFGMFATQRLDV